MRRLLCGAVLGLGIALSSSASHAGVFGDELGKCLVQTSTGQDKVTLVQWMFAAMTLNPHVSPMSAITPEQRERYNRAAVKMIERLVFESCREQTLAAVRAEGPSAFHNSFALLGQVAARDLMMNPAVTAELGRLNEYMDKSKWQAFGDATKTYQ